MSAANQLTYTGQYLRRVFQQLTSEEYLGALLRLGMLEEEDRFCVVLTYVSMHNLEQKKQLILLLHANGRDFEAIDVFKAVTHHHISNEAPDTLIDLLRTMQATGKPTHNNNNNNLVPPHWLTKDIKPPLLFNIELMPTPDKMAIHLLDTYATTNDPRVCAMLQRATPFLRAYYNYLFSEHQKGYDQYIQPILQQFHAR